MSIECYVPACNNMCGVSFEGIPFPKDEELKQKWISAIYGPRDKSRKLPKIMEPKSTSLVCPNHFTPEDYKTVTICGVTHRTHELKPNTIPNLDNWTKLKSDPKHIEGEIKQYEELVFNSANNIVSMNEQLKLEVNKLTIEHIELKQAVEAPYLSCNKLFKTPTQVIKITGALTQDVLQHKLTRAKPFLQNLPDVSLSFEDQLVAVLSKLQLNLPDKLMCLVYSISLPQLHQLFKAWVSALAIAFTPVCVNEGFITAIIKYGRRKIFCDVTVLKIPKPKVKPDETEDKITSTRNFVLPISHALCFVAQSQVLYISKLFEPNIPILQAVRDIEEFSFHLKPTSLVYIEPLNRVVTKQDIQLGVVLDTDLSETNTKLQKDRRKPFINIDQFQILKSPLEEPFSSLGYELAIVLAGIVR
ncbi:uncharacterized protein LOC100185213 [Ciona intestinalis]